MALQLTPRYWQTLLTAVQWCRITGLGMNIVTVVHQPRYSVFRQFHEVLLLGQGGRTVFLGPSEAALPYFASLGFELPPHENPADFFLDVISGTVPCRADLDFRPKVGRIHHNSTPAVFWLHVSLKPT